MSRSETVKSQKEKLRKCFRARRDALSIEQARGASARVCGRLGQIAEVSGVSRLAGYMAVGSEVDIRPFLSRCIQEGREVFLPRVVGAGVMEFCAIGGWDELVRGAFGIDEPIGPSYKGGAIELYLVPGLAFDRRGHRLGYGKGFYDRALAPSVLAVGVGYDFQLIDEALPVESHDRAMDIIITEGTEYVPVGSKYIP